MAKPKKTSRPQSAKKSAARTVQAAVSQPVQPVQPLSSASQSTVTDAVAATQYAKLPSSWSLLQSSLRVLWGSKELFLGIIGIYAVLNLVLVQSAGIINLTQLKSTLDGSILSGVTLLSYLFTATGSGKTETSSTYQSILITITSLAIIWALRETLAGHAIRIRDSFYKGMYPLIPVLLVVLVILVQLLPLAAASFIFSAVMTNGIAVNNVQVGLWSLLLIAGTAASAYFLTSSLFAGYIAALPDMTPIKALRSARKLVRYRRWTVLRKLLFLPFVLLVAAAIIMFPFIMYATVLAPWLFFVLSILMIPVFHAYMYTLYRELLT